MNAFGRAVGAFFLLMSMGYVMVVLLLPAPGAVDLGQDKMMTGRSAADALSAQARSLVTRRSLVRKAAALAD